MTVDSRLATLNTKEVLLAQETLETLQEVQYSTQTMMENQQ